jgi:hypothetical protein
MRKVSDGFRVAISNSIVAGDGNGKPLGILHPLAGIPILDTSVNTPPGQITWQDTVMLKWDVPVQWHGEGSYLTNQRTWALIATMSDAAAVGSADRERAALPSPQQTAATEKIATLGREIAELSTPNSPPSLASWG